MIRFIVRLIAVLLLAGGFAAAVIDGTRSIAANSVLLTSLGDLARTLQPAKVAQLQPMLERINPRLWDPVMVKLLAVPACIVFAVLGLLLLWIVRRRQKPIGFSSRP